jgi:4-hydroxy-2-oxoheptanedioate aldolase
MQPNRIKQRLKDTRLALATYAGCFRGPEVVELIGHAGYDGVFIDMEHVAFDLQDIQHMLVAAERFGITSMVRTPGFDPALTLRLLDMGAQGILIPHVTSAECARAAVDAVRYTPVGKRGLIGYSRSTDYGKVPLLEHIVQSNREVLLGVLIEDAEAIEHIDAIAAVPGIDIIGLGPNDLAGSMGIAGQPDHPKLVAAMERMAAAVRKTGPARLTLPLGHPMYPRTVAECRQLGVGLLMCGAAAEVRLLRSYTQEVAEVQRTVADTDQP